MTTPMSEARLKICNSCEFLVEGLCSLCGCEVAVEALDPKEKCPAGQSRWPSITSQPTGADIINQGVCAPCQKNR